MDPQRTTVKRAEFQGKAARIAAVVSAQLMEKAVRARFCGLVGPKFRQMLDVAGLNGDSVYYGLKRLCFKVWVGIGFFVAGKGLEKPGGQPLTYDFIVITEKGCHDLLGLSLPVPSTTSCRAEIAGKRFSGMNEIDGSFWAISPKVRSATG
jgi:hypothetical protein